MTKKLINENINYKLEWYGKVSIEQIRKDLDAIEALRGTHIDLDYGVYYDAAYLDLTPIKERLETDAEYWARFQKERNTEEEIKQRELKQLEYLKNKYKNGTK